MWLPKAKLAHCTMLLAQASECCLPAPAAGNPSFLPACLLPGISAFLGHPHGPHSHPLFWWLVGSKSHVNSGITGHLFRHTLHLHPPLPPAGEAVTRALSSERYRRYKQVAGSTPTKGILGLLKQYSAYHRSVSTQQQGPMLPDAFRLLLDKRTEWLVGIKSMTFWHEASACGATSSVQILPASSTSTFPPPLVAPTTTSPGSNLLAAAGKKKPSHWFPGLVLHQKLRERLAALPPASVQQVIAACDAALSTSASLRANAAAASATGDGGGGDGSRDDDDDGSGWSEVHRPSAKQRGSGGGSRLDTSTLLKGLARTVMKVWWTCSRLRQSVMRVSFTAVTRVCQGRPVSLSPSGRLTRRACTEWLQPSYESKPALNDSSDFIAAY